MGGTGMGCKVGEGGCRRLAMFGFMSSAEETEHEEMESVLLWVNGESGSEFTQEVSGSEDLR